MFIKPKSPYYHQQPLIEGEKLVGEIIKDTCGDGYPYKVNFPNGTGNVYRGKDLELADLTPNYEIY